MEDHIQTVLIFLISAVILFIFPVYIAYEKKDDISYALALKYTQEFVDDISEKGYITKNDYETYRGMLSATGNMYDIEMQHKYVSVSPVVKYYKESGELYKTNIIKQYKAECADTNPCTLSGYIYNIDIVQSTQKENYGTEIIINTLNAGGIYTMNKDDTFSVIVKNSNTTLATLMYNIVSLNDNKTRIYVNCSKKVLDTKWYSKDMTYNIFDTSIQLKNSAGESFYTPKTKVTSDTSISNESWSYSNFTIECRLYPKEVIDIKEVYSTQPPALGFGPAFIIDNSSTGGYGKLMIYVGMNGVMVYVRYGLSGNIICMLTYQGNITSDNLIEIAVRNNTLALFIDGIRVSSSSMEDVGISISGILLSQSTKISKYYDGEDIGDKTYLKVFNTI